MYSLAIFGGTFDPVHNGHIQTGITIQNNFHFDSFCYLPCKIPALKPPAHANNEQRIEMLQLALKNRPDFSVDLREIKRNSPSYMVETLKSFRKEHQNASITLILGYDSFISLPQWHQWTQILTLANILVINRNHFKQTAIPEELNPFMIQHRNDSKDALLNTKAGTICFFDAGNYPISSTDLRNKLRNKQDVANALPQSVYEYIKQWALYQ